MENFTPISAAIGGLLIGSAATLVLWTNGRIAGISGILAGALSPQKTDTLWRILFIVGLLAGAPVYTLITGNALQISEQATPLLTVIAGLLVGFGTRLGSGCTSGHGICGIARFSKRSFAATLVFIASGVITVFLVRNILGDGL